MAVHRIFLYVSDKEVVSLCVALWEMQFQPDVMKTHCTSHRIN